MYLKSHIIIFYMLLAITAGPWGCTNKSKASPNADTDTDSNTIETWTGDDVSIDIDWISVSNGTFTYGSPATFPCRGGYDEEEVEITLTNNFVMAATEVTQKQWQALDLPLPLPIEVNPEAPMSFISFYDAAMWCNRMSLVEGLDTCYDLSDCSGNVGVWCKTNEEPPEEGCREKHQNFRCSGDIHKYKDPYSCPGYRLPATAEWEYAAKAGTTGHTYNGDVHYVQLSYCEEEPALEDIAWYCNNANDKLHSAGQKQPNPWGFYDMLGNAAEWVDYANHGSPINTAEGTEETTLVNPTGPKFGEQFTLKGGYYYLLSGCHIRPSYHVYKAPWYRRSWSGFRPVRTLFKGDADDSAE